MTNTKEKILSPWQSFTTGVIAGTVEISVNFPLWTIKTLRQSDLPVDYKPGILYKGFSTGLVSVIGMTGAQLLGSTLTLTALDTYNLLSHNPDQQKLLASVLGGALSAVVSTPPMVVVTQMHKQNVGFVQSFRSIVTNQGITGLQKGLTLTSANDAIFVGAFYGGYPYAKNLLSPYIEDPYARSLVACAGVGVAASLLTHPVDTIKTKQQSVINTQNQSALTTI